MPPAPKNKNELFIVQGTPISLYIFRAAWTVKVVVFRGGGPPLDSQGSANPTCESLASHLASHPVSHGTQSMGASRGNELS